ncbi:short-chain dehydrogenase [Caldovatus sediminis]|uniref:Short-chain dehydrogenase n=1 Tax=Caldovatus sediminis TaxID=2041189 RepID=A0A8J2ZF77_9PROT|nr:SDR family NAD(P)-dependent oxidoreductase [Caldovatus sediminis]GGG49653.1 short-chain dehydrogenase [Caldovatus sediminis]
MARLRGRRVLVTGAASGIGRATARRFAAEGARVALLDRDATGLEAAAREGGGTPLPCDLLDTAAVAPAVERAAAALGGLDGVVCAAGVDLIRKVEAMSPEDWARVIGVNLTAPMLVCRAALPAMRASGGGAIVLIASGAGLRPLPDRTAYCASKAGVVMFGKTLAIELAADNIRVNAICPGIVDTPMFRRSWERAADPQAELAVILDRYAIKRIGTPEEIAAAALYLVSDEAGYVTGAALAVDGGRTFH